MKRLLLLIILLLIYGPMHSQMMVVQLGLSYAFLNGKNFTRFPPQF
ncbi:MAG TPA: hypothetical protein VKY37_11470 [Brumimicrobium sp.]|nr:hypothetical protein [Brumimicrobium sp.]